VIRRFEGARIKYSGYKKPGQEFGREIRRIFEWHLFPIAVQLNLVLFNLVQRKLRMEVSVDEIEDSRDDAIIFIDNLILHIFAVEAVTIGHVADMNGVLHG
jgi:hypothetical protein